jgi:hypothetical protein
MVKIENCTLVSERPFVYNIEPSMLAKSLFHHFLEQRENRGYPGFEEQVPAEPILRSCCYKKFGVPQSNCSSMD